MFGKGHLIQKAKIEVAKEREGDLYGAEAGYSAGKGIVLVTNNEIERTSARRECVIALQ